MSPRESFQKFDEIKKQKTIQLNEKSRISFGLGKLGDDDEDDDDEVDIAEIQGKLKNFSTKHSQNQNKSGKSFFASVKKIFS